MADDPTLPSLSQWSMSEPISPSRPKKRVRLSSPIPSSDPPIFSSDDDPSLDNYTHGHTKKQYQGPWFQQQLAAEGYIQVPRSRDYSKKSKRVFERQYDSGVFLGSDCTDMDETIDGFEDVGHFTTLPLRQPQMVRAPDRQDPSPEDLARIHIDSCIEYGVETIDLSYVSYPIKIVTAD
jgi:hypothetical protein